MTIPRNNCEAALMKKVSEYFQHRHIISPTTGKNYYIWLLRDAIKELRSYRSFLDWESKNPVKKHEIPNQQLSLF